MTISRKTSQLAQAIDVDYSAKNTLSIDSGVVRINRSGIIGILNVNNAFTFPTGDGSSNQYLKTDGSGNVIWSSVTSGSTISINNSGDNRLLTSDGSTTGIIAESNLTFDGTNFSAPLLISSNASGDEGGEIKLIKAPNSTIVGNIIIDNYQNKIRFFEDGGTNRGYYIDIASAGAGVSSNLAAGGAASSGTNISVTGSSYLSTANLVGAGTVTVILDGLNVRISGSSSGGTIDGSGISNYVSKWSDSDTLTTGTIYDNGTNIGIGTSSPSFKLHVIGTGNFSQNLLVNGTGVSLVGHTHTVSDISNFNSSVSGLVSGIYAPLNSPSFVGTPLVPTAASGTNTTQAASTAFVRTEISNLIASAPATLDTLNELAAALGNDANFSTTITNSLAGKANLSGATFTGSISAPTGSFNTLQVTGIPVSVSGHSHVASDISNFNSTVSGLLPTITNSGNNRVLTSTGSTIGIDAESNLTFDGTRLSVPSGSASSPSITAIDDTDTGMYFSSANTIGLSTSGIQRLHINEVGNIGIGSNASSSISINLSKNITGSIASYGIVQQGTVQSGVSTGAVGVYNILNTAAADFSCGSYNHFQAASNPFGSGSSVTVQAGFAVGASITGATTNFGFRSSIASGTGRWNTYIDGTAQNWFAGNVGIGSARSAPNSALDVNGLITSVSGNFTQSLSVNNTGVSISGHTHTISVGTGDVAQLSFNSNQVLNIVSSGGINITFNDTTNTITIAPPTAVTGYEELSATKSTFTVSPNYRIGTLSVYYNGFKLINGRDYTATNGTSFVLAESGVIGDVIEWVGTT